MGVLMADHGVPAGVAVIVGLLRRQPSAGDRVGIVATRINGFIVTLATMTILLGSAVRSPAPYRDGYSRTLARPRHGGAAEHPPRVRHRARRGGSPGRFHVPHGRGPTAPRAGGNPLAARLSGISTDRQIVAAHTLSGLLIGVAAVTSTASLPGVNRSVGGDWLLPSFAAPITEACAHRRFNCVSARSLRLRDAADRRRASGSSR